MRCARNRMPRYLLKTDPPLLFEDRQAGLAALVLCSEESPFLRLLDTKNEGVAWVMVDGNILPKGALLTRITPQHHGDSIGEPCIEVYEADSTQAKRLDINLKTRDLENLIKSGIAIFDCSSGEDPDLHYCYDHYRIS